MLEPLRLGDHCSKIGSGATPHGGKDSYLEVGPFRLIRSQNIYNSGFAYNGLVCISNEQAAALNNVEVLPGDVLLNITGDSVARSCQVDDAVLPARVNQHVAIIRPNPVEIDPRFLRFFLISPEMQSLMLTYAGAGATRNALTKNMIENFKVPGLNINVQREIGRTLGTLDDKIELNRQMNETLEAMARAIFKDWFVDFGPTRAKMAGHAPYLAPDLWALFPDRLDDKTGLPEGWEVSEIGKEVEAVGGATPSTKEPSFWDEDGHHWATPKDLSKLASHVLLDTQRKITDAGVQKISSGLLPVGTVLLSSRAPIGYLAIAEMPTAVNQGFIAMICNKRLPNTFVLFWCHENLDLIKNISGGSTFSEISKKAFRPIPVNVPTEEVISAYESIVRPLCEQIVANTKETVSLAQTRDLLLPKLMSGDIRLRDAEKAVEAVA